MKKSSTTGSGGSHWQGNGGGIYKVLKLTSGETVLCEFSDEITDFSFKPTIDLIHPVLIKVTQVIAPEGMVKAEAMAITPFLSLTNSRVLPISTTIIVTMGDMKPAAIRMYKRYVLGMMEMHAKDEKDIAILELLGSLTKSEEQVMFIDTDDEVDRDAKPKGE